MRILFVHSGADLYGASRSLLRLASRLVADRHEVLTVLPFEGPLSTALRSNGVSVQVHRRLAMVVRQRFDSFRGKAQLLLNFPLSVWTLSRIIQRYRPDLVHTNTGVILSSGVAARLRRVPHIWHMREFFTDFAGWWSWYRRFMQRFADRIVCVSEAVAEQFGGSRGASGQVVVVHNALPEAEFGDVDQAAVARFRSRYGLDGHRAVGVVGRIKSQRKGQDVFVRAAALLRTRFPEARYLLIGSPYPGNEDHLTEVMKLADALGLRDVVRYTGDVEDVRVAYRAMDLSVLPSALPEPFAGVVLESMALGTPVVGTAIGGTPEQIVDGVTGLLVPPNDAERLAAGIGRLLSDDPLRKAMGEAARRRYRDRFEFEPFYRRLLGVYAGVLGET